uniref:Uncharacterized protein n=1 Tax=Sus scrofa TaxID=9823 RepID=A0A8D1FML9_PIG
VSRHSSGAPPCRARETRDSDCPPPPSVPVAWMGIHPHYLEMREFDIGDAAQVSMAFLVYQALVEGKLWHKVKGVELLDRQLTCFVDAEIGHDLMHTIVSIENNIVLRSSNLLRDENIFSLPSASTSAVVILCLMG